MPINMSDVDRLLKEAYTPALQDRFRGDLFITNLLDSRPVYTPIPKWRWFLRTARERLNSCYMHLRYGECDDLRYSRDD